MLASDARVFPNARPTTMWAQRGDWPFLGAFYAGANPPRATPIRYYLREAGEDEVKLAIRDAAGRPVRTLEGPAEAGINEVLWDWRHDAPYVAGGGRGGGAGGGGRGRGGPPRGPIALPGTYAVSLTHEGVEHEASIEIVADPRRPMSSADRAARQRALMVLHALAVPIRDVGEAADAVSDQLDAAETLLEAAGEGTDELSEELKAIRDELDEIREELGTARRNAGVASAIQGSSTLPTEDHLWQVDRAWALTTEVAERMNALARDRMSALNARLYAPGLRPASPDPVEMPERPGG